MGFAPTVTRDAGRIRNLGWGMLNRRIYIWLILVLTYSTSVSADNAPSAQTQLDQIVKNVADAESAYFAAVAKLPSWLDDDPQVKKLREEMGRSRGEGMTEALQIAQADPKSR